jgi:hypothetical protein
MERSIPFDQGPLGNNQQHDVLFVIFENLVRKHVINVVSIFVNKSSLIALQENTRVN